MMAIAVFVLGTVWAFMAAEAQDDRLTGPWLVEDIGGAGVLDNARTTIVFEADGRVFGSGGCNRYRARAQIGAQSLQIGPAATTRKACVPALMNQEGRFFAALTKVRSHLLEGGFLFLRNESGETLLRLTRASP